MEWTIEDISLIGIALWVALWAVCRWRLYRLERQIKSDPNRLDKIPKFDRQLRKWQNGADLAGSIGFVITGLWITIVPNVLSEIVVVKDTTYADRHIVYVPYSYHGQSCKVATSYISNETDVELTVYGLTFFNDLFWSEPWVTAVIGSGELREFKHAKEISFSEPYQHSYVPREKRNKLRTERYIDETGRAHVAMDEVRKTYRQAEEKTIPQSLLPFIHTDSVTLTAIDK